MSEPYSGYKVPAEEDKNFELVITIPAAEHRGEATRTYYFKSRPEMEKLANRFRGHEMVRKEKKFYGRNPKA